MCATIVLQNKAFYLLQVIYSEETLKNLRDSKSKCPIFLEKSLMIFGKSPTFLGNTAEGGENSPSNVESPMLVEDK